MAKKIRIKDIAKLANVSPGTVDRVLHKRGNVSPKSKHAVESALEQLNYKTNIHLSAISLKKKYKITIVIPSFNSGEYWEDAYRGIQQAIKEYEVIDVDTNFIFYDQFDYKTFTSIYIQIEKENPNAVIIGPTFINETITLTQWLEERKIPYAFVDSFIEGTTPLTSYLANQYKCGYLVGRLIDAICPPSSEIVLFQIAKSHNYIGNSTILRKNGFVAYFNDKRNRNIVHTELLSPLNDAEANKTIVQFFEKHPNVKGCVMLSSRGHMVANYIEKTKRDDLKLVCVDLTSLNRKALLNGDIKFVVGQRPRMQGFMVYKSIILHLVYGHTNNPINFLSLDIITPENIEVHDNNSYLASDFQS